MGDPARFRGGQWEPAYPEFAVPQEGPLGDAVSSTGAEPWADAPAGSHLLKFRYWDARRHRFLKTLYGGKSLLDVVFRPSGRRGATSYTYFFSDPEKGRQVFEELRAADHPGRVVHRALIRGHVPYARTV